MVSSSFHKPTHFLSQPPPPNRKRSAADRSRITVASPGRIRWEIRRSVGFVVRPSSLALGSTTKRAQDLAVFFGGESKTCLDGWIADCYSTEKFENLKLGEAYIKKKKERFLWWVGFHEYQDHWICIVYILGIHITGCMGVHYL